jgi:hypothetical protein
VNATITARGKHVTVVRRGQHLTLTPSLGRRLTNPLFVRTVHLHIGRDVRFVAIHEPRGLARTGWVEFGIFIDIGDPKFAEHAVSRVEYARNRRREFAQLVTGGNWNQILVS